MSGEVERGNDLHKTVGEEIDGEENRQKAEAEDRVGHHKYTADQGDQPHQEPCDARGRRPSPERVKAFDETCDTHKAADDHDGDSAGCNRRGQYTNACIISTIPINIAMSLPPL